VKIPNNPLGHRLFCSASHESYIRTCMYSRGGWRETATSRQPNNPPCSGDPPCPNGCTRARRDAPRAKHVSAPGYSCQRKMHRWVSAQRGYIAQEAAGSNATASPCRATRSTSSRVRCSPSSKTGDMGNLSECFTERIVPSGILRQRQTESVTGRLHTIIHTAIYIARTGCIARARRP